VTEIINQYFAPWRIFALALFFLLPMSIFAHKGIAAILIVAGFAAAAGLLRQKNAAFSIGAIGWILLGFVLYSGVSALWSLTPERTLSTAASLLGTFAAGYFAIKYMRTLDFETRRKLETAVIAGGILGYGWLTVELATQGYMSSFVYMLTDIHIVPNRYYVSVKPAISVAVLYFLPWILLIYQRSSLKISLLVAIPIVLTYIFSGAMTPALALVATLVVFPIVHHFKSKILPFALGGIVIVVAIMPIVSSALPDPLKSGKGIEFLSHSMAHRIVIWKNTVGYITKKPILGHGFDTSRALSSQKDIKKIIFFPDIEDLKWPILTEPIPLHPHNMVLQVWLETGFLGAVGLVLFLSALVRAVFRNFLNSRDSAATFGIASGAFLMAGLSFGAWQSWWLATLFLIAVVCAAVFPTLPLETPKDENKTI